MKQNWNAVQEGGHFEEVLGLHKLLGGGCVWAQIKEEIRLILMNTKKILKIFRFLVTTTTFRFRS